MQPLFTQWTEQVYQDKAAYYQLPSKESLQKILLARFLEEEVIELPLLPASEELYFDGCFAFREFLDTPRQFLP